MNYLLPHQQVLLYNEKNNQQVEKWKQQKEKENLLAEERAQELYKKIHNFTLAFTLKKDERGEPFGSISLKEILAELEKSDFHLEKKQLLDFHPLNKLGENIVPVKLSNKLIANLRVIVN